jgi:sugar phosphate isomerase/epimerase
MKIYMQRRKFIRQSGTLAISAWLAQKGISSLLNGEDVKMKDFGIQLWTIREDLAKNPKEILKQLASDGYTFVESFEGANGMFWGMKPDEFKKYIAGLGMTIHSAHCDPTKDLDRKIGDAAEIGMQYLIMAWEGPGKTIDDYRKYADDFNKWGEACKKGGIRFAFHNHNFSFQQLEGQIPQEVLLKNTDPELVDFEMDIFWVVAAGQDPDAWFKKYPSRFKLCHVKDLSKTPGPDNGKNSVVLGTGTIDFKKVLKTAKQNGMQYYIVEQEWYEGTTPMKSSESDAAFMKKLKF